jgi:YHS domain-containing protein
MMLKFVILAAVCFILYKMVTNDKKKKVQNKKQNDEKLAQEGVLVKDPVCGTYVSKDSDIRIKEGGDVKCFCSYECRDKYLKMVD